MIDIVSKSMGSSTPFMKPDYYVPRPEASIAQEQFEGDNRDRILFVSGTSGVGKSTLIRKCSEKEKNPTWIYCRNITNITELSYPDIKSSEYSCVIFDDVAELFSNLNAHVESPAVIDFMKCCSDMMLKNIKLVFISANYLDALRLRSMLPGAGTERRVFPLYLGCVEDTLAEKCIMARVPGLDSEEVLLAVKEIGGKFSDLVEFTDKVRCGNNVQGSIKLLKRDRQIRLLNKIEKAPKMEVLLHLLQQPKGYATSTFVQLGITYDMLNKLVVDDIVTITPEEPEVVAPACPLYQSSLIQIIKEHFPHKLISDSKLKIIEELIFMVTDNTGTLGFKLGKVENDDDALIILEIPKDAIVYDDPKNSKARCSKAFVRQIFSVSGTTTHKSAQSCNNLQTLLIYNVGTMVVPDKFSTLPKQCAHGIHYCTSLVKLEKYFNKAIIFQ